MGPAHLGVQTGLAPRANKQPPGGVSYRPGTGHDTTGRRRNVYRLAGARRKGPARWTVTAGINREIDRLLTQARQLADAHHYVWDTISEYRRRLPRGTEAGASAELFSRQNTASSSRSPAGGKGLRGGLAPPKNPRRRSLSRTPVLPLMAWTAAGSQRGWRDDRSQPTHQKGPHGDRSPSAQEGTTAYRQTPPQPYEMLPYGLPNAQTNQRLHPDQVVLAVSNSNCAINTTEQRIHLRDVLHGCEGRHPSISC